RARKAEARKVAEAAAPAAQPAPAEEGRGAGRPSGPRRDRDDDRRGNRGGEDKSGKGREDAGRRTGKLTVTQAFDGDGRQRSLAAMKRKQERARQKAMGRQDHEKQVRDVQVPETIVVSELANRMAERTADVVKALMKMGMMVTGNQSID